MYPRAMNPSNIEKGRVVLHATIFRSKRDLVDSGKIGDTAEFNSGHDKHEYEITESGEQGVVLDHRKNGEPVE